MKILSSRILSSLKCKISCQNLYFPHNKVLKHEIHFSSTNYVQPTHQSHPHLLQPGEIFPGITAKTFNNRRKKLMHALSKQSFIPTSKPSAHLVVIPSASTLYMSDDIPYFFRQKTDFLYLCGIKEPHTMLVMCSSLTEPLPSYESILIMPHQSSHTEKWEGKKLDATTLSELFGIDRVIYTEKFQEFLFAHLEKCSKLTLWYDYFGSPSDTGKEIMKDFMTSNSGRVCTESPKSALHHLRLLKSDAEINLLKRACKIGAESFRETMRSSYELIPEAHLQTVFDYECRLRGADHMAFPPVVGGGDRANTIHYIENNNIVGNKELVLMDAGCEYQGYASDISRTWPVSGKFTDAQRDLYDVVLKAQEELIELCKTRLPIENLYKIMCYKLGKGLQELHIIPQSASEQEIFETAKELCPHNVGHYLGMDVHDTNLISKSMPLQSGMVVTVEPGLYISKSNIKVPEKYRGIGIRIEDDVLITDEGIEVLTSDCPKHVHDIEDLLRVPKRATFNVT